MSAVHRILAESPAPLSKRVTFDQVPPTLWKSPCKPWTAPSNPVRMRTCQRRSWLSGMMTDLVRPWPLPRGHGARRYWNCSNNTVAAVRLIQSQNSSQLSPDLRAALPWKA